MDLRRLRYVVALGCLIMTVALVTHKLSTNEKSVSSINTIMGVNDTPQTGEITSTPKQSEIVHPPTDRTDIATTIVAQPINYTIVYQSANQYLLMNSRDLIPLSTTMYDGVWTGVVQMSQDPLIVYYRYETANQGWTYLYDNRSNSSRVLDQLVMVGKVGTIYLFSIPESDGYRGLSAMIQGQLQTLYTGNYQTAQYLGDVIRLNHSQTIYLSQFTGS